MRKQCSECMNMEVSDHAAGALAALDSPVGGGDAPWDLLCGHVQEWLTVRDTGALKDAVRVHVTRFCDLSSVLPESRHRHRLARSRPAFESLQKSLHDKAIRSRVAHTATRSRVPLPVPERTDHCLIKELWSLPSQQPTPKIRHQTGHATHST